MNSEQLPQLREQIDQLAVQLLLAEGDDASRVDPGDAISSALFAISERAHAEGWEETSRLAVELVGSSGDHDGLRAGLLRLQSVLEEDCRRVLPAEPANPVAQDPELLADFLVEAREHLSNIEQQCLAIEQDPQHAEAIHALFRSFHTIKGLAGFLELGGILDAAHEVETVLDLARNGDLLIEPNVRTVVGQITAS
jgi:two-component system chemotaxis sensor kinase CheA